MAVGTGRDVGGVVAVESTVGWDVLGGFGVDVDVAVSVGIAVNVSIAHIFASLVALAAVVTTNGTADVTVTDITVVCITTGSSGVRLPIARQPKHPTSNTPHTTAVITTNFFLRLFFCSSVFILSP